MAGTVLKSQAIQLLHNKFVVVLGSSTQRSVYKDLVLLLQRDEFLSSSQLKSKGELSFERDSLIEGGRLGAMTNGTAYREVRQYRSEHHLVRFYFVTQVFSPYMESILADFEQSLKPDLVIVNSCIWDVSRYGSNWTVEYRDNLNTFFRRLKAVLPETLVVWNMAMPLGKKIKGGFLVPEVEKQGPSLRSDIIEANYYGSTLANDYGFDVLDLHFQFRFSLNFRADDGVHWNAIAHRNITSLLLRHAAQAWKVKIPDHDEVQVQDPTVQKMIRSHVHHHGSHRDQRHFNIPMPANHYNNGGINNHHPYPGPAFRRMPQIGQNNGFGPQFYQHNLPPPLPERYNDFAADTFIRGGHFSNAAPCWPVNNLAMKQKHRIPYNPYPRQKPRHLWSN